MIKYIIPAIIIFLIVLFWEKITEFVEKKFNIKLNYIVVSSIIAAIAAILSRTARTFLNVAVAR